MDMNSWFAKNKTQSKERSRREGSPLFTYKPASIVATAQDNREVATQFPTSTAYRPLNFIEIVNNDVVNLTLILNANEYIPVPVGTIRVVRRPAILQFSVRNDDAATATPLQKPSWLCRSVPCRASSLHHGQASSRH